MMDYLDVTCVFLYAGILVILFYLYQLWKPILKAWIEDELVFPVKTGEPFHFTIEDWVTLVIRNTVGGVIFLIIGTYIAAVLWPVTLCIGILCLIMHLLRQKARLMKMIESQK